MDDRDIAEENPHGEYSFSYTVTKPKLFEIEIEPTYIYKKTCI